MNPNALMVEQAKFVDGLCMTVPSTSTPDYVSMKGYSKLTALIKVKNATTVTGSAITLKQATTVAGGGEKELAFSTVYANEDTGATDTLVATAVTSNTFTTDSTNSKNLMYIIEVDEQDLDQAGGFDCVRVGTGDAVAATVDIAYILWPAKYGKSTTLSAILN